MESVVGTCLGVVIGVVFGDTLGLDERVKQHSLDGLHARVASRAV